MKGFVNTAAVAIVNDRTCTEVLSCKVFTAQKILGGGRTYCRLPHMGCEVSKKPGLVRVTFPLCLSQKEATISQCRL